MKHSKKVDIKEYYLRINKRICVILDDLLEKHPDSEKKLKELFLGVQILNNEYILKNHPELLSN
jgi:hypothetical protein|nr:MAG TPA: hypothetical protein [Caudoviricetes sp.]